MAYTEIMFRKKNKYFYRVISIREGSHVKKRRIYLGANLDKRALIEKEVKADKLFLNERIKKNIEDIKPKVIAVLKRYKVKRASLFGSYTRGEHRKNSDIDILIKPPKGIGFEFVGIEMDLEKSLNKKVDLVTYKSISPHIKKYILKDEVRIL